MPVGWRVRQIVLNENLEGPKRVGFDPEKGNVICLEETPESIIVERVVDGKIEFTREYFKHNILRIDWDRPIAPGGVYQDAV
jgi:hypothetical protein